MDTKDKIKQLIKISDYFDKKELVPNGDGFKTCCPFHGEKTPSFFINKKDDIEVYHCFGCSKGGDIFSFLQEKDNKDFTEVFNELSEQIGESQKPIKKIKNKTHIDTLEKVNEFFITTLKKRPDVIDYLNKERSLEDKDIDFFKIGFSEGNLLHFIRTNNLSEEICEDLHLIKQGDNGYYDIIKNRITIPLYSKDNLLIGISSRKYTPEDQVKYVNPTNNSLFKKNSFMYGFNLAAPAIKEHNTVILTEGYFDFITMYKHGIHNCVALMSTTLMADHVKNLAKISENFYFCLDGDAAGRLSIIKNAKEAIKSGVNIFIIELPEGDDPDSFLKQRGVEGFNKLFHNAKSILDYIAAQKENDIINILEDLKDVVPKITSVVKKQFWYKNIKDIIGIDLTSDVKKEFFLRNKNETLTFNDLLFLKLYNNGEEGIRSLLEPIKQFDTERAKLLYLKMKNTLYKIEYDDDEKEILDSITLKTKTSKEDIDKIVKRLNEEKRLK